MLHELSIALGGLGIFFAGMFQLQENLKKLTGRRFKQTVAAWVRRPVAGVILGIAAGGVMQSAMAVTFILASMIAGGLVTVAAALPIIAGANVGTTFLVMFANLDIEDLVLVALGLSGVAFIVSRLAGFRTLAAVVFAVGLVFLGLQMLQTGIVPLTREPWFGRLLSLAGVSYFLPLLAAMGLTLISQSGRSVALLMIALATAGGLTFEQAMMAIYGSDLGSSIQATLLSSHLSGRPKQVAMCQVLFNVGAACLMVPLFFVEQYGHIGLAEALARSLSDRLPIQLALVQVNFNIAGAVILLAAQPWILRFLARRFPVLADEDDGQPAFIHEQAIREPEFALDLVRLEQRRLASFLPQRIDLARRRPKDGLVALDRQNQNFTMLAEEVHHFLRRLGTAPLSPTGYNRLNRMMNSQRLLDGLNQTLVDLAKTTLRTDRSPQADTLADHIVEGLDAVVLTMVDALDDAAPVDKEHFYEATRDRGSVMQRIRDAYLAADAKLSTTQRGAVLILTNLAERALWLLGQFADQEAAPGQEQAA